jgi:propionate CoA-transferase
MQSSKSRYDPTITGEIRVPGPREPVPPGTDRVILARAAAAFRRGAIVNLGVGTADAVAQILWETGCEDLVTFTTEHGAVGGIPLTPPLFGAHANADAIVDPPDIFNFYQAGGLDITLLGLAEADGEGNVNVSRFGPRIAGVGGFIDIAHATRDVYFCGPFAAKGAKSAIADGIVRIDQEGAQKKFVRRVQHLTFNGRAALRKGQRVHAITERGMLALRDTGWELVEIAPGLDPARDLQPMMDFPLAVSPLLTTYAAPIMSGAGPAFASWLRERIVANGDSQR